MSISGLGSGLVLPRHSADARMISYLLHRERGKSPIQTIAVYLKS